MDKQENPTQPAGPNVVEPDPANQPRPPPYSELPPPQTLPNQFSQVSAAVYSTHPHQHPHHQGHYGGETITRTHVVTQQPGATVHVIHRTNPYGPNPRTIVCSTCRQTVSTTILSQPSLRTHLLAMSLCIVGCWPCAPMVYCMDCCTNVNHYCSNCNAYQGTFVPGL